LPWPACCVSTELVFVAKEISPPSVSYSSKKKKPSYRSALRAQAEVGKCYPPALCVAIPVRLRGGCIAPAFRRAFRIHADARLKADAT
jgi:hypothetical protein